MYGSERIVVEGGFFRSAIGVGIFDLWDGLVFVELLVDVVRVERFDARELVGLTWVGRGRVVDGRTS